VPFAIVLVRPELDRFDPGEHNGTFRGDNSAFVAATAALERHWRDDALARELGTPDRASLTTLVEAGGSPRRRGRRAA
jgi:4-aminobutyrate aminotransferase-like enzyme